MGALAIGALASAAPSPAPATELRFRTVVSPDGVPVNVVEAGQSQGPTVLFLHGFSQSYLSFLPQLGDPLLLAKYRLVAIDLRGHGASGKPWAAESYQGSKPWADDVRSVVMALGLERPVLVGWSFGGYVAMDYVREYGAASLAGLLLASSHGGLLPRPASAAAATSAASTSNDLEALRTAGRDFMSIMSAKPQPEAAVERGVASFMMLPPYVRRAIGGMRLDNVDLVGHIDAPILFVLGGEDPSVPHDAVRALLSKLKIARLEIYQGAGHSTFAEATARFDADLAEFADSALARQISATSQVGSIDSIPLAARRTIAGYLAAVNAGDASRAESFYAPGATMFLGDGRIAQGSDALRAIEEFHARVRPHIEASGFRYSVSGARTHVSIDQVREHSPIFAAMGVPVATTEPIEDAFVVENGHIVSAVQPPFTAPCRQALADGMTAARAWLNANSDPRLSVLLPGGVPRMDASTAPAWLTAFADWQRATHWTPDATLQSRCAARTDPNHTMNGAGTL